MKQVALIPLAIALAALLPIAALAKGASQAWIEGPGLDDAITLSRASSELAHIADASGFYVSVFRQVPDPTRSGRPSGELGPRYTITYRMPGPYGEIDDIRQDVYPYAEPRPVTHVRPDQPYFGDRETVGSWYVASTNLRHILVAQGLPENAPTGGDSSPFPWTVAGALGALGAVLTLGALGVVALRRKQVPAATT